MHSNESIEPLDLLRQQHEKFAKEIIYSLRVHYSIDEHLLHDDGCLTNREFVSHNVTKAVITIAYLFRHESRKLYSVLREKLRDVGKFKTYCMLVPVAKNNRYFYNFLRRVSLISELVIYCFRESYNYFDVATNCIADYGDLLYFESAGGWTKLDEISSFVKSLGKPFELLFDHPITEQSHEFNTLVVLHEVDAIIRNDVDLLCSKELRMLKIIRHKFLSRPQKCFIQNCPGLIADISRNINGVKNAETTTDEQRQYNVNDEKKAIIEYLKRCLVPGIVTKFKNTLEKNLLPESSEKIYEKEIADNTKRGKESIFSYPFTSNKYNFEASMLGRKKISVSTSTDYHSSTHSEFSSDSSSEESSDTVVSGCLPRKKLIKVLLKKRNENLFQPKRTYKPFVCELTEDQITKRMNIQMKLLQTETPILSRNVCSESTGTESCSVDESIHRSRELSEDDLSLHIKQINTTKSSLSDEISQSAKNADSSMESIEDKNVENVERYSSSNQSPSENSQLQEPLETNIQSSSEEYSQESCRIYSSTGSSITSESEFSVCTAGLYEDSFDLESPPDSKMHSDDLPGVTSQSAKNADSSMESIEDKNLENVEMYSNSYQSQSENSQLQEPLERSIENSSEEYSHEPSRIYFSTGFSMTSESEFSVCTAGLYEDPVELESSLESKMHSDDLPGVTGSRTDEDNLESQAVASRAPSSIQSYLPCFLGEETECSYRSSKENCLQNKLKTNIASIERNRTFRIKSTENTFYSDKGGGSKYTQTSRRNVQSYKSYCSRDSAEKSSYSQKGFLKKESALTECNEHDRENSAFHVTETKASGITENCERRYNKKEMSGMTGAIRKHLNEASKNETSSIVSHPSLKEEEIEQQNFRMLQMEILDTQREFIEGLIEKHFPSKTDIHEESTSSENSINPAIIPTCPETDEETCSITKNCLTASEKTPRPQNSKAKRKKASKKGHKKK